MSTPLRIVAPVEEPVIIGKIGSAYGIRGYLRVFSYTHDKAERIFDYQPWFIQQRVRAWALLEIENWRHHNHNLIIKVKNIADRKAATLVTNCEIIVEASQLPDLDSGEYYWKDLLECQVFTVGGYQLGKVIDLIATGSNDVMIVQANQKDAFGINKRLIPFIDRQVIQNVDLTSHIITVDWDPGFSPWSVSRRIAIPEVATCGLV